MLAACGESKVTKVDGSSVSAADASLKKMMQGMKDDQYIQVANDFKMLHSRYKGDEFLKVVGGKDLDGLKAEAADTKAYFIAKGRERFIQKDQDEIDRLQARVDSLIENFKSRPDFDPETNAYTSGDLAKIRLIKERQEGYKTQDSEEFWKEHGCGCYESQYKDVKVL
jgi:hypothetical protein